MNLTYLYIKRPFNSILQLKADGVVVGSISLQFHPTLEKVVNENGQLRFVSDEREVEGLDKLEGGQSDRQS